VFELGRSAEGDAIGLADPGTADLEPVSATPTMRIPATTTAKVIGHLFRIAISFL
jgi:hypothetical protein